MSNLLPIFTSPDIVKVFHGCDHDILWLQRDFGLYVVNCFDTYHAAKLLRYPALSLAHLLKYYCGVILNKKYQLADWRLRKLTDEMIHYAQSDTHYLLYIYDNIRKDIFHHQGINGVIAVLQSSQRTCLKRYEKEYFYPHGYLHLLNQRTSQSLTLEQNLILSLLWNWRDLIARKEDESVSYIMSNSELIRIGLRCPKSELEFHECGPFSEFLSSTKGMISHLVHFIGQELGIKPSASSSNVLEANISDLDMRHRAGSSNASIEEVFLEDPNLMNSNSLRAITPDHFSKPIHVLSAQDGRFGQVHRLQGCNTIKEIHPSIGNRDLAMASPGADLFLASTTPISHFDDEKQQFELHSEAEWKQVSHSFPLSLSSSPFLTDLSLIA
jgi:ribonuclease D